jgi:NAD(P)-dependent dehydrogenase (short-subunit alcohol dehydrogenase family)
MSWSPAQIPSLAGTTAVVTGSNSGIGLVTATELARHGAQVVLACRKVDVAEQAAEAIRTADADADVRVAALDLASLESVEAFADAWSGPLDLLVNNAGVMMPRSWRATADGFELQFGTNHLGHFALTGRLLPALLAAPSPRVVTVASLAHRRGNADVLQGNPPARYQPQRAYGNSKLANLLFGIELQRRAESHAPRLTSTVAHPGVTATNLFTSPDGMGSSRVVRTLGPVAMKVLLQTASAGANPTLYAATEAEPGSYTGPSWPGEMRGPVGSARRSALARDEALAAALWERSEELTGVRFPWPALTP